MLKAFLTTTFLLLLSSTSCFGKTYSNWELLYGNDQAKITKVDDTKLKKRVFQFESISSRDTYINGAKQGGKAWNNSEEKILQWQFNVQKSYVIIVSVMTLDGHRNIIYTSGNDNGNLYFGLGEDTLNGEWQTIVRDLDYDLHRYEPHNSIVRVNAFIFRGSGKIAKVELLKRLPGQKKKVQEKAPQPVIVKESKPPVPKSTPKASSKTASKLPTIRLKQGDLIYHRLGEPFFDPGATARDTQGKSLQVDVIGEVNINKVNKYTLTYMATDSEGNTATQARVVMVHRAGVAEQNPTQMKSPLPSEIDMEKEDDELLELPPLTDKEKQQAPQIIDSPNIEEENLRQEEMLELLD